MEDRSVREEVLQRLTSVEGKIDLLLETTKLHSKDCDDDRNKMNGDIKALERKQSWMMGVGSTCVVVFGAIVAYFKGGGA